MRYAIVALFAAVLTLFSSTAASGEVERERVRIAKQCQERAVFAGQVITARDRGLSQDEVERRVSIAMREVLSQPVIAQTLGVAQADLKSMLGTIRIVWTWKEDRDAAVGRYFDECMTAPDV